MIKLLCIGKMKDRSLYQLQTEYCKRLQAFTKVEIIEVKDEPTDHMDREKEMLLTREREGERALSRISRTDYVVLLDLHGKSWDSEGFAQQLEQWRRSGRHLVFVIAGSLGPSPALIARADVRWKLSDLTFTHLMTRVIVLEQIYRGFMITAGRNYHK